MLPLNFLYSRFLSSKKKERFEIILEPLQAILQLSLLSVTPLDTKINIYNNILYIQTPTWKQSISRTYNNDSKNDLFFLFSAISRFNKFYDYLTTIGNNETNLFSLLIDMSKRGIDNLLQTYKQTDNPALLHTLIIYKNILDQNPLHLSDLNNETINDSSSNLNNSDEFNSTINYEELYSNSNSNNNLINSPNQNNIDNVFINIRNLYSTNELNIIFNTLLLIQKNPNHYLDYIYGLNYILEPINKQIKNWITDNIVY